MTLKSTTIRASTAQRDRLRRLAEQRGATMAETLDAALEALRRERFYEDMADSERRLRADPQLWAEYLHERDRWLATDLAAP